MDHLSALALLVGAGSEHLAAGGEEEGVRLAGGHLHHLVPGEGVHHGRDEPGGHDGEGRDRGVKSLSLRL